MTLAVDDANASQATTQRIGEEFAQRGLGLIDTQAVQIAPSSTRYSPRFNRRSTRSCTPSRRNEISSPESRISLPSNPCRLSTSTMARSAAVKRARAGGLRLAVVARAR